MSIVREMVQTAMAPLAQAVERGQVPGGVIGAVDRQGHREIAAIGSAQTVPVQRPMRPDTWFDLASLTKVLFTTPHILDLANKGTIDLHAPLTSILADFRQYNANAWERQITFAQCLGHTTPFPAVFPLYTYGRDADLLRTFVLQHEWRAGPAVYSDINFILLGLALERLTGRTIRQMDPGPGFGWSADADKAAATEHCTWRHRVLSGEVHDDNCSALQGAGHAGLFGTASAVLDFAHARLNDCGPQSLIRTPLSSTRTYGWEKQHYGWSGGEKCSSQTIGHTGFTGTGVWIDFECGHAWTLLTNRIHPTRHHDSGIAVLRRIVGDTINAAHGKST